MKFLWALFAFLLVVAALSGEAAAAATGTGICLRPGDSKTFNVGESWATGPPNKCAKHTCKASNKIVTLICATLQAPDGCTEIPGDQTAVYPKCCPDIQCTP